MKPFLTAEWRKLILLTYSVDPSLLVPYLPKGLELDLRNGHAFVSFVAFDFLRTKVKSIPIPFHVNFPEINLRFYVKQGDRRGVCFIREFVPRRAIAWVAQTIYNEPYRYAPMKSNTKLEDGQWSIEHVLNYGGRPHKILLIAEDRPYFPAKDSTEFFFKEHEWGFGLNKKGQLTEYKVEHPEWKIYPIETRFNLDIDFSALYGSNWQVLNGKIPYNILLAEGSEIKVFPGQLTT